MKPLYLTVTDKHIRYSYEESDDKITVNKVYTINSAKSLGQNLDNFKTKIPNDFDVVVILNPIDVELRDTIVSCGNLPIDMGLTMENLLHIPTVGVHDVARLGLKQAVSTEIEHAGWHLEYYGSYSGKRQYGQESMQTIGNGYFGLRGSYVEAKASDDYYPGTYVAGVFDQLTTNINNRDIVNEDLVNLPNAQYMTFSIDDGDPFELSPDVIENVYRSLDMRTGVFTITMIVSLPNGKKIKVITKKVADMKNFHNYSLQYTVQPLNFSGEMKIFSEIDGSVTNSNVERYRDFDGKHLVVDKTQVDEDRALLLAHTKNSNVNIAVGTRIQSPNIDDAVLNSNRFQERISQSLSFHVVEGRSYTVEKTVSIYTSLETDSSLEFAVNDHAYHKNFADAVANSMRSWQKIWANEDIELTGDVTAQKLLRLNEFHATVSAQDHVNENLDASVGARGLHGEAYRGHIFWDELFVLPYYTMHYPNLTKALLMYRYNRLPAAKRYAEENGYKGAMYPWQSGMYGDEQSQSMHLNPITNSWDPDNSRKQRHVSLAIAYNIWNYYNMTLDDDFIKNYGLEMMLNIAKLWISMAEYDPETKTYSISNVMGPDEFHEGYPNAKESGLKNNAYTNIMTSWLFDKINYLLKKEPKDVVDENLKRADFTDDDLHAIDIIGHDLKLEFNDQNILGQFEGYFKLKDIDFDYYRRQYGDISRMDRILKSEGDSPDQYQLAKQADALMGLYNLREETFLDIMKEMGYPISDPNKFIKDNVNYYLQRTTHGSTLSRIVYSMLALKVNDKKLSWELFYQALTSDYYDIQGGTTAEGIHLGVMGATLNVVTSYFAGVDFRGEELTVDPNFPESWNALRFNLFFRGIHYYFTVTKDTVIVEADQDTHVQFKGEQVPLNANESKTINY
ncbi:glycoside hydrolase family 65 protein [Companilactobacillus sp.]|jgi:trehalose/maltose hydrolase-like predicted phosphorylase|uniref:glycoside hydrolase family 65 protein n=1 Tax=Companilactobacillus sp. TaxID=2767905 RepID=UPI0025C549E1|nr:glycosyl hydrolase family 65 protein [Companilactobacillus sp.]MCH4008595.1 glycoside hydrolase family 65 protein [Companilactobacillus sp.]MCH4051226.1 glycoside hydrolase family 65 protein [Companilactobacillus sp.]MCH4076538.1 glycoside hydrolase family 65 protein [Companilactobacillus sp.]MCH4125113.1 glycoside hydrolase family 65 protein [Companilactobacillus sp.]MCH4131653.1 glycoside hydrolase family 65 protein [Companilactobacillus sp.]